MCWNESCQCDGFRTLDRDQTISLVRDVVHEIARELGPFDDESYQIVLLLEQHRAGSHELLRQLLLRDLATRLLELIQAQALAPEVLHMLRTRFAAAYRRLLQAGGCDDPDFNG